MGLDKFLDLLLNQQIVFTQAQLALDKNEFSLILKNFGSKHKEGALKHINFLRHSTYISCWAMKNQESRSLWYAYLDNTLQGVAICSSVDKFLKSVDFGSTGYDYRIVDYRDDLDREEIQSNIITINTKSVAYKDESEVRFNVQYLGEGFEKPLPTDPLELDRVSRQLVADYNSPSVLPKIRSFKVDLDNLIEKIYISPYCQGWQKDNIKRLIEVLCPKLKGKIYDSSINEVM